MIYNEVNLRQDYPKKILGESIYIKARIGWKGLKKSEYIEKSEYRIINGESIKEGNIDWKKCGYISKERYFESPEIMLQSNDIVMTKDGTIGKLGIIKSLREKSTVASGLFVLRVLDKQISYLYLYYYLCSPFFKEMVKSRTEGSVIPHLYQRDLVNLEIPLPNYFTQISIANILSSLDDKIELNNKINKNLEELAQTLYRRWFVDFEFPNDYGEPYQSSGGEMVLSELGFIPKGWEVKELSDVALVSSGKRPPIKVEEKTKEFKYPVIGASGVMAYTQEYNIDEKILIIGRVGTHGIVQRISEKVWASDNTLTIKSNAYEFVYQILNQIDYKSLNRGSTQPLITQTDINKTEILVPKSDLLEYFEKVVSSLFEVHKHNLIQNYKLSLTRDELLPKLMNGEIEVPIEG